MFRHVVIIGLLSLGCLTSDASEIEPRILTGMAIDLLDEECSFDSKVTNEDYENINTINDLNSLSKGNQLNYALCLAKKNSLMSDDGCQTLYLKNFKQAIEKFRKDGHRTFFDEHFFNGVNDCYQQRNGKDAVRCLILQIIPWVKQYHSNHTLNKQEFRVQTSLRDPEMEEIMFDCESNGSDDDAPCVQFAETEPIDAPEDTPPDVYDESKMGEQDVVYLTVNVFHRILLGKSLAGVFADF